MILHCSDSDRPEHDDVEVIRAWHLERGFSDVGYHYFIKQDGTVQSGRPLEQSGAHCKGHNTDSIGICLSGRHEFTHAQFFVLATLLGRLQMEYHIPKELILGHNHFDDKKTCPNFNVEIFKSKYMGV